MKKSVITFICILLCVLIPVGTLAGIGFLLPAQFDETFLGELAPKIDRLYSLDSPKIIIIGGSSVPFGVDTKLLTEATGMECVNFGLYATLGTKLMMDLSRGAINDGDIIVIAAEPDAQTYSLYFNAESAWQACDSDFSILGKMSSDDYPAMAGAFWKYAVQKLKYAAAEEHLDPDGVYNKASFDDHGDIIYDRPYNVMAGGFDSSNVVRYDSAIISPDFIDYVNEYTAYAEKRGATVYLSFSPVNEDAIDPETTLETLEAFTSFIDERFAAERITDPNDCLYRSGYFYDSNFHMNTSGMTLHTRTLANDICAVLGHAPLITIEKPSVPEIPDEPIDKYDLSEDKNAGYFTYEQTAYGYILTGTTDDGKMQTVLTTPRAYNGGRVYAIAENAFSGCVNLTDVYICDYASQIADGAFRGAPNLVRVHIAATDPNTTTVNNLSGLLTDGMNEKAKFMVPTGTLNDFAANYFWGPYTDWLTEEK